METQSYFRILKMRRVNHQKSDSDHAKGISLGFASGLCRGLLSLVFPGSCVICDARLDATGLCDQCEQRVEWIGDPACRRCGCPGVADPATCPNCVEKPFNFDRLVVPWQFGEDVQRLLHGLKYEGKTFVVPVLVDAIVRRIGGLEIVCPDTLVVPVPLHASRFRERGYNQSQLLARGVARRLGIRVGNVLNRIRQTATQTRLGLEDRARNVDRAFTVRLPKRVSGKPILLVDDVCTTGATVNACTKVLLDAHASGVTVVAAASPYLLA